MTACAGANLAAAESINLFSFDSFQVKKKLYLLWFENSTGHIAI